MAIANPALSVTIVGIKNGDRITASVSTTADPTSPVGTYPIVATLIDPTNKLGNYAVTINNGTLTVNPAPLSVTAANASRLFGTPNPPLQRNHYGNQERRPDHGNLLDHGNRNQPGRNVSDYSGAG